MALISFLFFWAKAQFSVAGTHSTVYRALFMDRMRRRERERGFCRRKDEIIKNKYPLENGDKSAGNGI